MNHLGFPQRSKLDKEAKLCKSLILETNDQSNENEMNINRINVINECYPHR